MIHFQQPSMLPGCSVLVHNPFSTWCAQMLLPYLKSELSHVVNERACDLSEHSRNVIFYGHKCIML